VFKNRLLRKVFGLKRDKVTGHYICRMNKEEEDNAFMILVEKPERKRPLGKPTST
jgi:hypothetical protein